VPLIFSRIEGKLGRIDIPREGIHVGSFLHWRLSRRSGPQGDAEPNHPDTNFYDFHGTLAFVNDALFRDPDYEKVFTIQLGKNGSKYTLDPAAPGVRMVLTGRTLTMERVQPCLIEEQQPVR